MTKFWVGVGVGLRREGRGEVWGKGGGGLLSEDSDFYYCIDVGAKKVSCRVDVRRGML